MSCTRGTSAPARGTARSRSRCRRCTGSIPASTVFICCSASAIGIGQVQARQTAVHYKRLERCNGTTNKVQREVSFLSSSSGRCQALASPQPPHRASATWRTCRRQTSSIPGTRSCERSNKAEIIVTKRGCYHLSGQVTLFLNSEENGTLTDGALSSRSCTQDELCAHIAAH